MAKKVKVHCAYCGKEIVRDEAYAVKTGKRNKYFCSYEHSIAKTPKQEFYKIAVEIFGRVSNSVFFGDMDKLAEVHGYEKMTVYLRENRDMIERYLNKDFSNIYAKIKYFRAILANNLDDFKIPEPKVEIKRETNVEFYESKFKSKEVKKGMDDLLNDLLGG